MNGFESPDDKLSLFDIKHIKTFHHKIKRKKKRQKCVVHDLISRRSIMAVAVCRVGSPRAVDVLCAEKLSAGSAMYSNAREETGEENFTLFHQLIV
jgi:hypothetical protein